jgi:hypothetical protein
MINPFLLNMHLTAYYMECIMKVEMVEVLVTDEFRSWYEGLDDEDAEAVYHYVSLLEVKGVTLGHPYSSAIKGSKYALRELRVKSRGRPLRVFYAFDPERNAVLLLGGDKTGQDRFYEELIPVAERLWEEYLAEMAERRHEE